ncbi:MAG: carboxypeptidase-like regulatory domain-containing protein [Candidatus Latescibacterota bacterium]
MTDGATGDPIPGATVIIEGTTLGTATATDGSYFIIGIEPGTYNVRFSFVGYATKVVENVLVTSDRTTTLDATLDTEVVEGAEVTITAARPVVDANQTTSRSLVTSEEISRLPARSLGDVIAKTSNSFNGYLRGSRRYETKTVVDGVDVSDAFYSTAVGIGTYGGSVYHNTNKQDRTSPSLFELNPDAVSEVAVNTGATEARYSSGTGGVVTVTLDEGRGPFHGSVSARIAPAPNAPGPDSLGFYNEPVAQTGGGSITMEEAYIQAMENVAEAAAGGNVTSQQKLGLYDWTWDKYCTGGGTVGDRDNCQSSTTPTYDFRGNVGGSISENFHLAVNLQYYESHGFMPNEYDKRYNGQLKSTFELSEKSSLQFIGVIEDRGLWGGWNNRDYRDFFRFNLESVAQQDGGSYMGTLKFTQVLSEKSFLNVQLYRTYWRDRYGYPDDDGDGFVEQGENGDFIDFFDYSDSMQPNPAWEACIAQKGGPACRDDGISILIDGSDGVPDVTQMYVDDDDSHDKFFTDQISDPFGDSGTFLPNGLRYRLGQPVPYAEDTRSATNGLKIDYTSQVAVNHFLQVGAEGKFRDIAYKQAYGVDGPGFLLNPGIEQWIPNDWTRKPTEIAVYASDRMEYAGLIVNLGLRVEAVNRDMETLEDHFFPLFADTISAPGAEDIQLARNFFRRGDVCEEAGIANCGESVGMDILFNPSIGVSHPIGTTAAMYFSYKRTQQLPPYKNLYNLYDGNNSASRFFSFADPEFDPITSDNYELGVQWEFSPGWGVDVNAYTRAIENYGYSGITANNRTPEGVLSLAGMTQYSFVTDFGFADSRGVELVLRRAPLPVSESIRLGLTASYTFATIEGALQTGSNVNSFNAEEVDDPTTEVDDTRQVPFDNAEDFKHFPSPIRAGRGVEQGYDRRHRGVLRLTATFPLDFQLGINGTIESGFLYPPAIQEDERNRELLTGPTNSEWDVRIEKRFRFGTNVGLDLYFDVTNILNTKNVIAYDNNTNGPGPFVFQETGVPGQRLVNDTDGQVLYGPARQLYFGARFNF